ncbi:MAG: hypothetical protein U9N35_07315, partial [Euryarchaeota archaeon]|nr:hypothetical protein [Euryarchaeota archaeon]
MKNKKIFLAALAIGLLIALIPPGSSNMSLMAQLKGSAFEEVELFMGNEDTNGTEANGTSTNSTIEEKLYKEVDDFYDSVESVFFLYSDSNSTAEEINATAYTIGDYEFYFGETEEGYYFGDVNGTDVNGTVYYIQDINGTLPNSADSHLSNMLPTFDKILQALEEGKTGRAFGLLTSCEARMKATNRYLEKVEGRKLRKEEREMELQTKREERELRLQTKREEKEKRKEDKDNNGKDKDKDNSGKGKGKDKDKDNSGKGKGKDKDKDNPGKGKDKDKDKDNPGKGKDKEG